MKPKKKKIHKTACNELQKRHKKARSAKNSFSENDFKFKGMSKNFQVEYSAWSRYSYLDLTPLYKILHHYKNCNWNAAKSEILNKYKDSKEILEVLNRWVDENPFSDGEFYHSYKYASYYVCEQGLLREFPPRKKRKKTIDKPKQIYMDGKIYAQRNGLWYRCEMTTDVDDSFIVKDLTPDGVKYRKGYDNNNMAHRIIRKRMIDEWGLSPEGKLWKPVKIESANTKEIKKLGDL